MNRHLKAAAFITLISTLGGPALAAGSSVPVNSTTFTDLGLAPTQLQVLGQQAVTVVIADTIPAVGTGGHVVPGPASAGISPVTFEPADASSHVWVAMYGGVASLIAYSPIAGTRVTRRTTTWPMGSSGNFFSAASPLTRDLRC